MQAYTDFRMSAYAHVHGTATRQPKAQAISGACCDTNSKFLFTLDVVLNSQSMEDWHVNARTPCSAL